MLLGRVDDAVGGSRAAAKVMLLTTGISLLLAVLLMLLLLLDKVDLHLGTTSSTSNTGSTVHVLIVHLLNIQLGIEKGVIHLKCIKATMKTYF